MAETSASQNLEPPPPAPLPSMFKVGDTYVIKDLSSGNTSTQEVIRAEEDSSTIRSVGGNCENTYSHSLMFYAPIKGEKCSFGSISRNISDVQGSLWPLQVGNKVSFYVNIIFKGKTRTSASCEVTEQGTLSLPYGDDNVFKVICRDDFHIITSYYSPAKQMLTKYRFERPKRGDVYIDREIVNIERQ